MPVILIELLKKEKDMGASKTFIILTLIPVILSSVVYAQEPNEKELFNV